MGQGRLGGRRPTGSDWGPRLFVLMDGHDRDMVEAADMSECGRGVEGCKNHMATRGRSQ